MIDRKQPPTSARPLRALLVLAATVWAGGHVARASGPTTAPTTGPTASPAAAADVRPLMADVRAADRQLGTLLPTGTMADPAKRKAAAAGAVPVLKRIESDFDAMIAADPSAERRLAGGQLQGIAMLAALGDQPSIDALASMASSRDPQQVTRGQGGQLLARWDVAGGDAAVQRAIADALDRLDRANPGDNGLAVQTLQMSRSAATPALRDRLQYLAAEGTSPAAVAIKAQLDEAEERAEARSATLSKLLDKPLTIAGTRPDGTPFTTANWKGKVVLVDFWATWCGPCRAELPHVKRMYQQYHGQGLEVVGVSNDYDVAKLNAFVADQQMPWMELFDPQAAADHRWNRVTMSAGIDTVPTMFLIDRKGVLRSVTARHDMDAVIPKLLAEPS